MIWETWLSASTVRHNGNILVSIEMKAFGLSETPMYLEVEDKLCQLRIQIALLYQAGVIIPQHTLLLRLIHSAFHILI